ncbi:hypothetical protein [Cryobacterium sp. TMT2-17-1]|uniref:hypothetical protein n=1 Tax=Cryobacterium sp. TMT2-17-1 TaxID=1259248 RepID=UPI00141AF4BE|nr:hypothetical protein [Cryobacterium sp. TMT2-17-1]
MFLKLPKKRGSSESGVLCNPGKSVPGGGLCDESTHRENFPRCEVTVPIRRALFRISEADGRWFEYQAQNRSFKRLSGDFWLVEGLWPVRVVEAFGGPF